MDNKIGFIGCGNMGSAMVSGIISSKFKCSQDIIVSTRTKISADRLKSSLGVKTTLDNKVVVKSSDIIFLAVKPNMYKKIIQEIKEDVNENKIIITVAAGITLEYVEKLLGSECKVVRTMPNTPALVREGISAICPNKNITKEDLELIFSMFKSFGEYVELEEKDFYGFTALCGSSPAYIFMFIEAMADGAVKLGIPRTKAYRMAAQSLLGSAKMVLDTKKHPAELKDMVCSPAGTTIEAVAELEKHGFRSAIIEAMVKCAEKTKSM